MAAWFFNEPDLTDGLQCLFWFVFYHYAAQSFEKYIPQ
jgi:hypothetical protein